MKVIIGSEFDEGIKEVIRINEQVGGLKVKKERDERGRILYYIDVLTDSLVWRDPKISAN
jgi:hypothetical protein